MVNLLSLLPRSSASVGEHGAEPRLVRQRPFDLSDTALRRHCLRCWAHVPSAPFRNCAKGTTVGGALGPTSAPRTNGGAWCRTIAQLRSARGAGVLPSAGSARFESIGACLCPDRIAGDEGRPGSAAVALGPVVCAPGVTVVVLESVDCVVAVPAAPGVDIVAAGVPERFSLAPGAIVCAAGEDAPAPVGAGVLCASA
jgi:hypothetical protein